MADNQTLHALRDKAHELRQAIVTYEQNLEEAPHALAVVSATLTIFGRDGGRITDTNPAHVRNLFRRGEVWQICRAALSAEPEGMTTRDLGIACLAAREFDHANPVLLRAMVGLLANTLRKHARKGELARIGEGNRNCGGSCNEARARRSLTTGWATPAGAADKASK